MKPVTIRDLAEAAGTSIATVSRALSGAPKVGRETRSRIIHLAEELGYRSGNHHKTIGLVLPSVEILFFDAYMISFQKALTQEIYRRGYRTIILSFEDIELLNETLVDGVLSFDYLGRIGKHWPRIKSLPLVCLNDLPNNLDQVYSVAADELQGMKLGVDYLVNRGHRRIGFLRYTNPKFWKDARRQNGFLAAMREHRLESSAFVELYSTQSYYNALGALLDRKVTAIFAADGESSGARVQGILQQFGKRIPEDISVIGWESEQVSNFLRPRQTTLVQNFPKLAAESLDLLEHLMDGTPHQKNILVEYQLIERDSVAIL
ncbi:LacI family DNA-binding transcriptional regulator [uncultured Victivallis sp.]|uniref:LacI family DNA-binding transcriptional regulator n=1 Tax=uncultured Victivallis sp. TaxID=354118 RepID=UPI0025D0BC18|nr:LacI family DNA-binding transcriptional regulator [uncultured Victivallis sp.]